MTEREKLVELISDFVVHVPHEEGQTWEEACADHLLANGVEPAPDLSGLRRVGGLAAWIGGYIMDIRELTSMSMDIGILRGLAMKAEESDVFDMITAALDDLEKIMQGELDRIGGKDEVL